MAKATKSPPIEKEERLQRYNQVVGSAELTGVQLVQISFDVQPRYYAQDKAKLGYVITPEESYYDPQEGFAACVVSFDVEARDDEGVVLECGAKYSVAYQLSEECDEDAVKAFLRRVGLFACYPYFRSVFANLDWAANTRLPPLPVHKEAPQKKVQKKKTAKKISTEAGTKPSVDS